ncbi:MAG: prolipoprotein diacylglyceryl transferase [Bacteroidaceae bacterium]|nr:prolipoprotein diacylglyceryl transferase [Bacteroidaceae bacterium]
MLNTLLYIVWNPPVKLGPIRYYSLLWIVGLLVAYLIVRRLYKEQRIKDSYFDPLFIYCFIGILAGCRIGHCLIYESGYYLSSFPHFVEMLLPVKFTGAGFSGMKVTGYQGLASHGGTIGLMIALLLYCYKYKISAWRVLDTIAIATPTTCCAIRLGNLMNSEIIGVPTGTDFGFVFTQVDQLVRHPSQLYEAIAYFLLFFIGWWIYKKYPQKVGSGFYFGFCLTCIFVFRIFVEFTKGGNFRLAPNDINSDKAQWFSIPYALLGIVCIIYSVVHKRKPEDPSIFVSEKEQAKESAAKQKKKK